MNKHHLLTLFQAIHSGIQKYFELRQKKNKQGRTYEFPKGWG